MKNTLLCGVALGAVTFCAPAMAQETNAVQLNLAGYFKGYVSYVDQDEVAGQSIHNLDILRQTEIYFDGKTKLDNGLTVGGHVEFQADGGDLSSTNGNAVDETYVYFSNDMGKVNLGKTYGTPYTLQVVAPAADSNIDGRLQLMQPVNYAAAGLNTASIFTSTYETDYDHDISAKVDKLSYISPVFSGFQAGLSYTPDAGPASRGASGNAADNNAADRSTIWEGAVRYENKVSDTLSYRVGGGYTDAQAETSALKDRQAWNLGLDLDIGSFGVGAAYHVDDLGSANDKDVKYTAVGADYTAGDYVYGASYYNKNDDVNNVDFNRYSGGVTYKVVPGLSFRGSVHFYDISQGAATDVNATALLLGTDVKF